MRGRPLRISRSISRDGRATALAWPDTLCEKVIFYLRGWRQMEGGGGDAILDRHVL